MFIYHDNISIEAVEYVTIAYGLGTVAEKFVKKPKLEPEIQEDIEQQ